MIKRQQIRVNKELLDSFKEKAFVSYTVNKKDYIKPLIDVMVNCYISGKLDDATKNMTVITNPLSGDRTALQVNKEIKVKLGLKAVKDKLLTKKIHAAFLIEVLMEEYIFGRIDKLINTEYYEWREKRNRKVW